jgi:hypothetical protein
MASASIPATVSIQSNSRYKDTPVFSDGGQLSFELQVPPEEFNQQPVGAKTARVRSFEIGFLDITAVRNFGNGNEQMWWAIAQANGMIDMEREMYPGMVLVVPSQATVSAFNGRQGDATV